MDCVLVSCGAASLSGPIGAPTEQRGSPKSKEGPNWEPRGPPWAKRGPDLAKKGSTGQVWAPQISKGWPHSSHTCLSSYIPFAGFFIAHLQGPLTHPSLLTLCGAFRCPFSGPLFARLGRLFAGSGPSCLVGASICPIAGPPLPT